MNYNKIKELCTIKGITIPQLAEKIDMSSSLYRTIKNQSLRVDTLEKIAEVLKVPITDFLNLNPDEDIEAIKTKLKIAQKEVQDLTDRQVSLNEILASKKELNKLSIEKSEANQYLMLMLYNQIVHLFNGFFRFWMLKISSKHPDLNSEFYDLLLQLKETGDKLKPLLGKYEDKAEEFKKLLIKGFDNQ